MKRLLTFVLPLFTLAILATVLGGCGKKEEPAATPTVSATPAASTAPAGKKAGPAMPGP